MAGSVEIRQWIAEAEDARHQLALGKAFVDLWRDGRRTRFQPQTIDGLSAYIELLKGELVTALAEEGTPATTSRRRAIGLAWRN